MGLVKEHDGLASLSQVDVQELVTWSHVIGAKETKVFLHNMRRHEFLLYRG